MRECAKPWGEADADVCEAIDFLEYYARGAIELLVRHPRELTTDLLVQRHDAAEAAHLYEPAIDLLICGDDAFELPAHVRIPDLDVLHD